MTGSSTKRLFIGLPLSSEMLNDIMEFRQIQKNQLGLRWIPLENIHVTVCFIGETESGRIENIIRTIDTISKSVEPFKIEIERFCFAPKSKPYMIWLKFKSNSIFTKLVNDLHFELLGNRIAKREFNPHATLCRFKSIPDINFEYTPETNNFIAHRMILWESMLLSTGATYTKLKSVSFH